MNIMREVTKVKTKICLVGEPAVGKTSLIKRFVEDTFDDRYISTIGTKVTKKEMNLEYNGKMMDMDMTIWDIMGHKGFRQLLKEAYFYGAQGIFAVCDVTRQNTLNDLDDWIDAIFRIVGKVPVIFVANKKDQKEKTKFGEKELSVTAKGFESPFFYTSAKTGENVEFVFKKLARSVISKQFPPLEF